uniref:Uncharacterized protein n=1 Tax=Anopheles minimus TaxID=112268 RepID=A0A182WER2_9DIPT
MSSRAKRSSILKKKANLPSTSSGRLSPVASLPSAIKTNKKIEFHRKKSVKEFDVGEDVDTIWGNSYEVSTDGTPSGGLEDVTLANNSGNRSKADDQNKENQPFTVDSSVRNNVSTSWDLSITIADDERRKIRNETSAVFSQSLNATERLLAEPFSAPQAPEKVKVTLHHRSIDIIDDNEVHAMDISPIKPSIVPSPRKLIYTFPKQAMFVEINDVPDVDQAEPNLKDTSQKQNPSIPSSWRTDETGRPTVLGPSSYNGSETWNSHSHARFQEGMLAPNRVSGDLTNVSTDVDTTIALTNAMAKVLQSRSNESIQKATNMELDESTTTLPTNALSRARPSFLPSNQRTEDDSQNVLDRTPTNIKQEASTLLPAAGRRIDTQSVDISPPMEGHIQRDSLSLDNLSIFTDMKQAETHDENTKHEGDKSPAEDKCEGVMMDFGLSALSMKLRLSSPVVVKPRILRPTLPIGMLETINNPSETTPGTGLDRQHKTTSEDRKEKELVGKQSLVPMDISTRRHTDKRSLATIHSRKIIDMVDSPKQSQNYRGTIFHSTDIEIDRVELQLQNSEKQRHRGTVLCDNEMELTALVPAVVPPSNNAGRRTNYVQQPIHDETAHIQRLPGTTPGRMKRGTDFGTIPIDESTDYSPPSPQTALDNYRKTVYTLDKMKEDVPVVPRREDPGRKTIVCNESMVLDVCAQTPNVKPGSESSMSCVVYGRNVAELSIQTTHGNNAVDMKFVRPTTFQLEPCDESAHVVAGRQTLMQEENMIVSEGTACAKSRREHFRAHVTNALEEDETRCDGNYAMKNDTVPSRKSIFKPEDMDITVVKEVDATSFPEEFKEIGCLITQATEEMNESIVHVSGVRMEANEHTGQECMDVHKTLLEGSNTNVIKSHQQSRIPRLTTHLPVDIQREEHVSGKPRYTIYEREDMDVTKLDCGTVPKRDNPYEYMKNSTIHPTSQHKSRYSIYEHEAMNATNVCEGLGRESHTGCADLANKMQHNVTNYNTFLDHHETSHGSQVVGTAVTNQTHLQGREFNSTRLSNAYERDNFSASSRTVRASSYRVEAMDETNKPPSQDTRKNFSENKTTITDARSDSPMHMSPVTGISRKSIVRHNSRQSSYYPEEMESTQIGETKADANRSTCIQSFGLRKSDLQRIARESDSADMEGISVLESDPTESKLEKYVTCTTQAAIMTEAQRNNESPVVETKQRQFKGPPNSRLSCYAAAAMVEETVPINMFTKKQGQSSTSDIRGNYGGATSKERKSNDCMEVTIVPENIRVERDVMYDTDRSHNRISNTVDDSPAAGLAKHPPMIDQHRSTHERGTVYGTEETMELTAAMNQAVEEKSNRQTIHQPANMELIFTGRETVTPPPTQGVFSHRGTIYNVAAMEETPPNGGVSAVVDTKVQNNVSTIIRSSSLPEPEHRLVIAERLSRRPRQTILIPQDMDVESEEDGELPGEEQPSLALSLLPRETTEDRFPRSASLVPKRTFFQTQSLETNPEFAKPALEFCRESMQRIERKTATKPDSSALNAKEFSEISMTGTMLEPEVPCIGNITGMMSMHEITEPLPLESFQQQCNSVSVICRLDGREGDSAFAKKQMDPHDATAHVQTMAFVSTRPNAASDDEFYDAEDNEAAEKELVVDPLSLTKSRHLTMKFIDVEQLEQTNYNNTVRVPGPVTTSKRVHAQVLGSPMTNRPLDIDQDPLQMTNVRQTLHMHMEHTPQGPFKKRPRKSGETPKVLPVAVVDEQASFRDEIEEVLIKEERQTLTTGGRASQTLINDPSVFMIEDQNLLDDESDLPCASLSEELQPDNGDERTSHKNSSTPPPSISRPPVCMLTELSYYKNFANLTIDSLDSYDEELQTPAADDVGETPPQGEAPKTDNLVVECISVSDEDSLIVTPPKAPCTSEGGNQQTDEVLDSTIASKIMYEIRLKHPVVKHPCCGMQTECLCQLRTELKRQQEMSDLMWNQWCTKFEAIKKRMSKVSHAAELQDGEKPRVRFEEQVEELNWRLMRGQVDDDFLFVKGELSREDLSRRSSRTIISGHYPETPSALFLTENFRSYLSEQLYVDSSPPPGAPLPKIPRITQLVANKLSTDTGTHWLLDCWDDGDGLLLLRHRTLRSFVISIQLQPPRSGTRTVRDITESWRLERIQVRECMEEYVHSPKLLLAHIEFMRVAKETTERTLRSTYRTVADLMGLWQHFHELLKRVLDGVNRLVAIIRNNDALLCYDAQMERFYVKKCVHRAQDGEVNTLLVHFNSIGSIEASGVSFKCPKPELSKLLPVTASAHQHTVAPGNFMQGVGTNEKKGLMFLECLLWNVVKHYDT